MDSQGEEEFSITKFLMAITLLCVSIVCVFDFIPWLLSLIGYHDFYNSQGRDIYNRSNLYILAPIVGTLTLLPVLIRQPKKWYLWLLLSLLWSMFLMILLSSIFIMLRLNPGAP